MSVARRMKLAVLDGCRTIGGFGWVQSSDWRSERLLILCYHGVSLDREHEWNGGLHMSPALLRSRFESIQRSGVEVLPLGEAIDALRSGKLSKPSVALTFDDGFYDFHQAAAPLLAEFGFPATVYLTTYYVKDQRPLPNLIVPYMLWLKRDAGVEIDARLLGGAPRKLTSESWQTLAARLQAAALEGRSADEKDEVVQRLAAQIGINYDALHRSRVLSLMDSDEVRELARAGIDFQLHTHRHRTPNDESLFRREIQDNRAFIEELTGKPANHFCYPSGVYRTEFLPWLRAEAVESATTCDPGLCSADTDALLLPRKVDTTFVEPVEFEAWLSGCEPRLRSWS
ncbi:MAG: polysaccharide deacetylase family protein [Bryobacterales bacterium]